MTTQIVNLKTDKYDVKITRHPKKGVTEPPEFGCFGNPYSVEKYGREKCIAMYREYFYSRIDSDYNFRKAILSLTGKRLACFCKPLACHGDIIKGWLDAQERNTELPKMSVIPFDAGNMPSCSG